MPYKDPEQARLNQARYRDRNREAIAARRVGQSDKIRAQQRARYHANPEKYRDYELRRRYGISSADYERMLIAQRGVCAVCEKAEFIGPGKRLHVDHDHKTKKVRGLVCVRCNVLIGMAQDQPERFTAAIQYLDNLTKI